MSIFEKATRAKLRFTSRRGELSTEDLWDLPLTASNGIDLDNVAKAVNASLREAGQESFVSTAPNRAKVLLEVKLEVVKHVIAVRLKEAEDAKNREARRAERERLLRTLEEKQDEKIKGQSVEEILARIAEIDRAPA